MNKENTMGAGTVDKLWAVAAHLTTSDNEAANAFVAFRRALSRRGGVEPYLVKFLGMSNNTPNSQLEDAYNSLRKQYALAENDHAEKIKQIEEGHQKALEQVFRRVSEAESGLAAKEAELADLKASGGSDELGIIAQRNSEIEALAVKLRSMKEAVQQLTASRDEYAAEKVAASERTIMNKILLIFGKPVEAETPAKSARKPASPKPAASAAKKPKRARQANRKGADTESIVSSLLTNEWKSVSTLFSGARRYGFTGVENAIRFAAERLVRAGNAEQGCDDRGHIAFRRT